MRTHEIAWLAGLLEGEGCFIYTATPRIVLTMTDCDVVRHAARLLGKSAYRRHPPSAQKRGSKPFWIVEVSGRLAAQWMMTLVCLLGHRRQKRVRQCLRKWRRAKFAPKYRTHCPQGHRYSRTNTYRDPHRHCRQCHRDRERRRYRGKSRKIAAECDSGRPDGEGALESFMVYEPWPVSVGKRA